MTRGRALGLLSSALSAIALSSCGGDDEPSRSDAATIKLMLSSSSAVQQSFTELYSCLPGERACYTSNGPRAVAIVQRERTRFADALGETDDECLRDVGELYLDSLDGYGTAAEAAAEGKPDAFDQAISRTTKTEIAYNRKLTDCGFEEGRTAEIGAAIRKVNVEILRLSEEIGNCLRPVCILEVAGRMEKSAAEGVALLENYRDELEGAPDCLTAAIGKFMASFRSLGTAAHALQESDFAAAEQNGTRAARLGVDAQGDMASCLSSLGA
jgi:hypothetical protein